MLTNYFVSYRIAHANRRPYSFLFKQVICSMLNGTWMTRVNVLLITFQNKNCSFRNLGRSSKTCSYVIYHGPL